MKKIAFILAFTFSASLAIHAANTISTVNSSVEQVIYCKVINDTNAAFEYKVGADVFTIAVGSTAGFNYEENTQILKKDTNGNWVNWFVYSSSYSGQNVQLSSLLAN
jgi:hypothetical protein